MKRKIDNIEFEYTKNNGYLTVINEVGEKKKVLASSFTKTKMRKCFSGFGWLLLKIKAFTPYADYQIISIKWNDFHPITWIFFSIIYSTHGKKEAKQMFEISENHFKFFNYNLAPEK